MIRPYMIVNWEAQEALLILSYLSLIIFFYWNFTAAGDYAVCLGEPYSTTTKFYLLPVLGATIGDAIKSWSQVFIELNGFGANGIKHPHATMMSLVISSMSSLTMLGIYSGILDTTCVPFWGAHLSPFLWIDWLASVPFLFFLIAGMDVKKQRLTTNDLFVQIGGGGTIYALFLTTYPLPSWCQLILTAIANTIMVVALVIQQYDAYQEYKMATGIMSKIPKHEWEDIVNKDCLDQLYVAQWKLNVATVTSITYTVIPILFYMDPFDIIPKDFLVPALHISGYFAKTMMISLMVNAHKNILDANKMLYIEEKKRGEQTRHMFLRYVFHEVRVPLNSIALGLQLINDSPNLDEQDQETIVMMSEALGFMNETLNDVLSLQKIEEGKLELERTFFSPESIISSIMSTLRTQYQSKGITVVAELTTSTPLEIYGDKFRLEHVLGNLLSNAIKFSDENSTIRIIVERSKKNYVGNNDYIFYTVKDTGPGIAPEDQRSLFQPFSQIRPGELQKGRGSGLGLSICKTIMALHDGVIGCTSVVRKDKSDPLSGGSEFYFGVHHKINKGGKPATASTRAVLKSISNNIRMHTVDSAGNSGKDGGERELKVDAAGAADGEDDDSCDIDGGDKVDKEDAEHREPVVLTSFTEPRRFKWQTYLVTYTGNDTRITAASAAAAGMSRRSTSSVDSSRHKEVILTEENLAARLEELGVSSVLDDSDDSDDAEEEEEEEEEEDKRWGRGQAGGAAGAGAPDTEPLPGAKKDTTVEFNDVGSTVSDISEKTRTGFPYDTSASAGKTAKGGDEGSSFDGFPHASTKTAFGTTVQGAEDSNGRADRDKSDSQCNEGTHMRKPSYRSIASDVDSPDSGAPQALPSPEKQDGAYRRNRSPNSSSVDSSMPSSQSSSPRSSRIALASPSAQLAVQHILICDDVLSNRKMLDMILLRKGFHCDKVEDGQEAVKQIRKMGKGHYDLIFMDSVMPNLCGPDATRIIRAEGYSNLLVGLTGNAMDVDIAEFEEAGADLVLIKPLRVEKLDGLLTYCGQQGVKSKIGTDAPKEELLKSFVH